MDDMSFVWDALIRGFRRSRAFESVVVADAASGNYCSAVDIALTDASDHCRVYRLILVKHG